MEKNEWNWNTLKEVKLLGCGDKSMGHDAEGSAERQSYKVFLVSLRQGIGEDDHACLFVCFLVGN